MLFRVGLGPSGGGGVPWSLKSVTLNGIDVTDVPVDLTTVGDITDLEIVISDKTTTLSGTVVNGFRAPVKDYVVAVFPDRLKEGAMPHRFTRTIVRIRKADTKRERFLRAITLLSPCRRWKAAMSGIRHFASASSR